MITRSLQLNGKWWRGWLLGCTCLALFLPLLQAQQLTRPKTPNIIFILADDLGYGDLGCYGQTKIQTPNLDRMAAEGMRFTQCYAGSTVCAPSRAALMTGMHSGHGLIRGNAKIALREDDKTVAEVLREAGYKTGAMGKWGLGDEGTTGYPSRKGFEEWLGYLDQGLAHNYFPEKLSRFSFRDQTETSITLAYNEGGQKRLYSHDIFTLSVSNFYRIHHPQYDNKQRPVFIYLAYTLPHANNELTRATGNGMEVPSDAPYGNAKWPQPEKNKAAMITRLDADVGRLMDLVKLYQQDYDTVFFFTSDNGPHKEGGNDPAFFKSAGPLRGIKRDLYEGGIRVPMIVRWTGTIKPGTVSDQPWAFWDFLPTAAEIAGAKPPPGSDGISMLPTLLGRKQTNQHEYFYWEFHEKGSKQAVRMGDWKGVRHVGAPLELFNLKTDLGEAKNVASQNPKIVQQIEEYMKSARSDSERWPLKPAEKESDEGNKKKK